MTDKKLIAVLRKACQYCNPTPCCEYELMGNEAADRIERLQSENTRLKAERDKAISTLSMYAPCSSCKFRKLYRDESPCNKCLLNKFYKNPPPCKSEWVWEGLEESE